VLDSSCQNRSFAMTAGDPRDHSPDLHNVFRQATSNTILVIRCAGCLRDLNVVKRLHRKVRNNWTEFVV
jgi:hypothetical protein